MIKNLKYLLFFLLLFPLKVDATSAFWANRLIYPDGSSYPGYFFRVYGYGYNFSLNNDDVVQIYNSNQFVEIQMHTLVAGRNLYTGAIVDADVYILTNIPIPDISQRYYGLTSSQRKNNFVKFTKVGDGYWFNDGSSKGTVYKLSYKFEVQDCLDGEDLYGEYICYADGYDRNHFLVSLPEENIIYKLQLYGVGDVKYSDLFGGEHAIEEPEKLGVWETIKALPSNIFNWIISLPGNIWNFIRSGFDWVVDAIFDLGNFILDLPGNIWNFIQSGFNWIVNGIGNLFTFFSNDDDVDVSGLTSIGLLPPGPVDSVLNLPFTFLNNLNNNLSKSCNDVSLPLPYVNKNLPLPCVNSIYGQISGLNLWISSISVILSGFILFKYLINLYKWVDDTLSFRENNHLDNWGGV